MEPGSDAAHPDAGVDMVDLERFSEVTGRRGMPFLRRLFTAREISIYRDPVSLAQVFAAKEAVVKGLGSGLASGVGWHDVEILKASGGRVEVVLTGAALELLGARTVSVSMGASARDAVAIAFIG